MTDSSRGERVLGPRRDDVDPTEINQDLDSVRKAATGYQTLISSALGLFSISGIVFGGDAIDHLGDVGTGFFVTLAVVAVLSGLASIVLIARSAYGWPELDKVDNEWKIEVKRRDEALRDAVLGLRNALGAAAISVVAVLAAACIVWFWPKG